MRIASYQREVFSVAFLGRVTAVEDLFYGTADRCEVCPRVVVRAALSHNADAILAAHNHPSGNPEPSAADRLLTARLKQALDLVERRLLDHFVVVPEGNPVSFAARGWV